MKKPKIYALFFVLILLFNTLLFPFGSKALAAENFQVAAKAAVSVDATTGKVLFDQNADEVLPIASMTKMLTLYLVLEAVKEKKLSWNDTVPIEDYLYELSTDTALSNVPLVKGTNYTVKELFDASAIYSANAAAIALATKVSGSESAFVDLMRKKLLSWGVKDPHIISASGLNNEDLGTHIYPGSAANDENKLSAKSVALIAQHLITDYPEILEVTKTTSKVFAAGTPSQTEMTTWDWMLPGGQYYKEGVDGLKTGTTDLAGECFAGTITKNNWRIITVVMNATNAQTDAGARFVETGKLMDYTYDNWEKKILYQKGSTLPTDKKISVNKGKNTSVPLVLKEDVTLFTRKGMDIKNIKIQFKETAKELTAPLGKNTVAKTGTIQLKEDTLGYIGTQKAPTYTLVTKQKVEKANFFVLMGRSIKSFFSK